MPIIQFNETTLRPNYPDSNDQISYRTLAGYFSANKSRSSQLGGLYVPPTNGEWNRFQRYLRPIYYLGQAQVMQISVNENIESVKDGLRTLNLITQFGINRDRFFQTLNRNLNHSYGHRTNNVGTDALLIIQTALNMYAISKQAIGLRAWKVDFIQSISINHSVQDDVFRGRCLFKLSNQTISNILSLLPCNDQPMRVAFWDKIFELYDNLARPNSRILNPGYWIQPVVRRSAQLSSVPPPPVTGWDRTVPRRSNEPAPTGRLAQEYLSRVEVDDSIQSDQLAEMLRRMGSNLSAEIRNTIFDMLTSDFNQQ